MAYITYENRPNKRITIHRIECNEPKKHGGEGEGEYHEHASLADAQTYAQSKGLEVRMCSYCKP